MGDRFGEYKLGVDLEEEFRYKIGSKLVLMEVKVVGKKAKNLP